MIFPTLFVILCILFVPESPCYLIMKGQHEEAQKSLKKLRQHGNIDDEIMELTATVKESLANRGGITEVIKTHYLLHLTSGTAGIAFCWSSPVSPKLENLDDNPLGFILSVDQSSWLASLTSLGAVVGPFAGGYLGDSIGRKRSLISTAILSALSFGLLAFGKNLYIYYIARFIGGICIGIFLTVIPMYIGEVAEVRNRGVLGGLCGVFIVSGQLFCFAVGPYISIRMFSITCMIFPLLFLIVCTLCVPESPCYLLMTNKHKEAEVALKKLRRNANVTQELTDLTATVKESLSNKGGILNILDTEYLRRGLAIGGVMMITQQFTAISVILFYMPGIFETAGSSLPKEISTIIVGTTQVVATLVSSVIADKLGRRPLMLISTIPSSICLLTLSLYFYLRTIMDVNCIAWLPIVALMVYIFFYNLGIGPMPITILSEIFPPHAKSTATSITIATCFLVSFATAKIFPILAELLNIWLPFLVFGIGNGLGVLGIWYILPETKRKTLSEILKCLKQK
ncbi:sugar transporter-like [Holotrichia oblita]|uniref:Sugar transporter-like n=1 Tax=Holotrichia oblita TaxID=644536 RepID=A0ACB9T2Q5_HOLOL|nr:sugar transporter-like [Holotrichia oblita]